MKIRLVKMHGLGNDFILIDCLNLEHDAVPLCVAGDLSALSKRLCHRRFGVGADQMLVLLPSSVADFRMRIFNADGGEIEMCGNGIRCFAKYIWDNGLSKKTALDIETIAGIIRPMRVNGLIRVDMGEPILEGRKIPVAIAIDSRVIDYPLQIDDREFKITCVSMGNPHAVIVVGDVDHFPVSHYGARIEKHSFFPNRTNVEFVEILNRKEIMMRVWERGAGETMACGTGASAVGVALNIKGLTERNVTIHLSGGDLFIEWFEEDNHVYMTGPAVKVFEAEVEL